MDNWNLEATQEEVGNKKKKFGTILILKETFEHILVLTDLAVTE